MVNLWPIDIGGAVLLGSRVKDKHNRSNGFCDVTIVTCNINKVGNVIIMTLYKSSKQPNYI
jgi:hypothetical protein